MCTRHIISIFNSIWIVLFIFKLTLMLVKFFLGINKTHFVNLVQIVLVVIRVQKYGTSLASLTFRFSAIRISCTALLTMALFSLRRFFFAWYGVAPAVLSRPTINVLRPKVSQKLTFFWTFSRDLDKTGFRFALSGYLHFVFCTCQSSHPSWGNSMTRRVLLSYACCDHHSWRLPV